MVVLCVNSEQEKLHYFAMEGSADEVKSLLNGFIYNGVIDEKFNWADVTTLMEKKMKKKK